MTELESLVVRLVGDATSYQKMLADAGDAARQVAVQVEAAASRIQNFGQSLQGFATRALGAFAGLGLVTSLGAAFNKFADAERTMLRLTAAIKASGQAVAPAVAEYSRFADEVARLTLTTKGAALGLIQQAVSLGLSSDQAERAVRNSIALAAARGGEAASWLRMAAALEHGEPGRLAMLLGLRGLHDKSKEAAAAQEQLGEMWKVAQADAEGAAGQVQKLQRSFGALSKEIGAVVAGGLLPLVGGLRTLVDSFNSLSTGVKATIAVVAGVALLAGPVVSAFGMVNNNLALVVTGLGSLARFAAVAVEQFGNMDAAMGFLRTAGYAALIAAVAYAFYQLGDAIGQAVADAVAGKSELKSLNEQMEDAVRLRNESVALISRRGQRQISELENIPNNTDKLEAVKKALEGARTEAGGTENNIKAINKQLAAMNEGWYFPFTRDQRIADLNRDLKDAQALFEVNQQQVRKLRDELAKLDDPSTDDRLLKNLKELTKHYEDEAKTAGMSKEMAEFYKKELDKLPASMTENVKGKMTIARASREAAEHVKKLADETKNLQKSFDEEMSAIGLNSEQAKLHRLEMQGLGAVDRILLEGKIELNKYIKEQGALFKEGADVIKQTRTPLEAYSDQIDKLQKMLTAGAITPNVFARALQEARKHFDAARESAAGARQEIQKLEGVLAGSAEAKSHLIDYTLNVLGPGRGPDLTGKGITMDQALANLPGPLPAPLPTRDPETLVPPPQAINDKVISVLGTIADRLLELVRKPTVPVVPAGLR